MVIHDSAAKKRNVLQNSPIIAFVASTDSDAAKAFYGDTLGLELAAEEPPHALVFRAGETMLRVSLAQEVHPAPYTVLGWRVAEIESAVDHLARSGVRFERYPHLPQDDRGIWTASDNTKVAWFSDPDGNVLSLTEFP